MKLTKEAIYAAINAVDEWDFSKANIRNVWFCGPLPDKFSPYEVPDKSWQHG